MNTFFRRAVFSGVIYGLTCLAVGAETVQDRMAQRVAAIKTGQVASLATVQLTVPAYISEFYDLREYQPTWTDPILQDDIFAAIETAKEHGFRVEDFAFEQLTALRSATASGDPDAIVSFDIVATEIAARLLHHLYFGKVDPASLYDNWTFSRALAPASPASVVNQYLEVGTLSALVEDVEIAHPAYRRLLEGLARYRSIADQGGWPSVPDQTVLRLGMEDPAVSVLRARLRISGDLNGLPDDSILFDDALLAAVTAFQTRHGLEADGVVGPRTFAALNTPVQERIDQLRASLERARWLLRDVGSDYVFVNIGGPETYLVRDNKTVWKARSIVGRAYRQTPVFRDDIQYMEFNPTWTVPVSIFRRDKLPLIRRDINYLSRGGYTVLDANGRRLDPRSVNWSGTPRVTLRQEPGPKNALGQVKFMFPNVHAVYLHDTDDRSLFDRNERNLSSGCVRIENPFEFADLLMQADPTWSASKRESILASGRTTRVNLPSPLPVLLTYFTAWMDEDGTVQFREDVYDRDARVLEALNADFEG